jgi:hypothetical protein
MTAGTYLDVETASDEARVRAATRRAQPGEASVSTRGGCLATACSTWRAVLGSAQMSERRGQPKTAFSRFPPLHRPDLERVLWVEAVRKPREFLQTIAQSEIFRDFFASKRSEGSKK